MSDRQIVTGTITYEDGRTEEVRVALVQTRHGVRIEGADEPITLPGKAKLSVPMPVEGV